MIFPPLTKKKSYINPVLRIGYPVAWCIADLENTDVVLLLFQAIKKRSPSTEIRVLMSDDGNISVIKKPLIN